MTSNLAESQKIATDYAEGPGMEDAHRAWVKGMTKQNRQVKEDLRLFRTLPQEDEKLHQGVALEVAESFLLWHNNPLRSAAMLLCDSAVAQGDTHVVVSKEAYEALAAALNRPGAVAQGNLTLQNIEKGLLLNRFNLTIQDAEAALDAGGGEGRAVVTLSVEIAGRANNALREVKSKVSLKAPTLQKSEFIVRASNVGGSLRMYDPSADAPKLADEKPVKKASKKAKAADVAPPAPAAETAPPPPPPAELGTLSDDVPDAAPLPQYSVGNWPA